MRRSVLLLPALLLLAIGCPPLVVVGPVSPGSRGGAGGALAAPDEADALCQHLGAIGCKEGRDAACAPTLRKLDARPIIPLDRACLRAATSREAAAKCRGVRCLP